MCRGDDRLTLAVNTLGGHPMASKKAILKILTELVNTAKPELQGGQGTAYFITPHAYRQVKALCEDLKRADQRNKSRTRRKPQRAS
jgi:hypothetical protein